MSLAIDTDKVIEALLADGWHPVFGKSFDIDSYEYLWGDRLVHEGGQSGVCASGFTFKTTPNIRISGPLTALQAVREKL